MSKLNCTEDFIEKAKEIHGDKYDYSKVDYKNARTKVCIICPEHGEFWQTPNSHLSGHGCSKCSKSNKLTTEIFIERANKVHNNRYDYSKVVYVNAKTKVCIICPEHGEFWQSPDKHLSGNKCPKCMGTKKMTTEEFIEKANEIHKNSYDYSKTHYINEDTNVDIICKEHGVFSITPHNHLRGRGCPYCSGRYLSFKDFVKRAREIHGDKYEYAEESFNGTANETVIKCKKHGNFKQRVSTHLEGCGCPVCSNGSSKYEAEIKEFIESYGVKTISRDRSLLDSGLEIDIYLPDLKIGIEFNGLYFHSEKFKDKNYHLRKLEDANKKGIRLIQIFEDEYLENKDLVLKKIKYLIGQSETDIERVQARKCLIKEITKDEAKKFLEKNHIQGFSGSTIYLGSFYSDRLIAVMSFKIVNDNSWDLTRFATDNNILCQGVGGKLFKFFIRNYKPEEIKSFADRRWTLDGSNNLYTKLGFNLENILSPEYRYYFPQEYGTKRVHKFNFRIHILNKKYGLPLTMTEREMCSALGALRVYDCGLFKYVWKNE